jgi:hypothetical protein
MLRFETRSYKRNAHRYAVSHHPYVEFLFGILQINAEQHWTLFCPTAHSSWNNCWRFLYHLASNKKGLTIKPEPWFTLGGHELCP